MTDCKENIFNKIAESEQEYLAQWYLDSPAIITSQKYNELNKIQKLLYKAINYFILHYDEYGHIFPIPDYIRRIMDICNRFRYRTGTYRPDFLIDRNQQIKICEIGTRFPLNGYFLSGIAEYIGIRRYKYRSYLDKPEYEHFLQYLSAYWGKTGQLYILKGKDRPCDIKLYIPFFNESGIKTEVLSPEQTNAFSFKENESPCVVNEFNQTEIDALDNNTLRRIASSNALNDLRTIFLIHDKRFLAVLSDSGFLSRALDRHEISLLQPCLIPTYTPIQNPEIWEEALNNKDHWALKNARSGKSEQVYTGRTCTREEWNGLFSPSIKKSMVLQPFIHQKRFSSSIKPEFDVRKA
jgi:hypothetical protein